MTTHFITAEVDLAASPAELYQAIEAELSRRGEPLRWAITAVDAETQMAHVEAIVTREETAQPIEPANDPSSELAGHSGLASTSGSDVLGVVA